MSTTMPTRIVVVTLAREQGITGVHTHVRQVVDHLGRTGQDVVQVTPWTWAGRSLLRRAVLTGLFGVRIVLEPGWGQAHVWWYRTAHRWFLRRALRRHLDSAGPCVVYAQCPPSAQAALEARTGPEQRVVLACHFRISQSDEWADKGLIRHHGRIYAAIREEERSALLGVDGLVFVSAWGRSVLLDWMPEAAGVPAVVIPNFAQPTPLTEVPPAGDLVSVGNLEAIKNHRYLLRVLGIARDRGFRYTLDVFGEGVERGSLERLAAELGIEEQVRWQGFQQGVPGRLPGYRAFVHASYSESLPLAVIEAMGAGLAVVAAEAGGVPELFDDPGQGRFWPIDDPEAAAGILIDLLEDEQERTRAGRAARARFEADYDADVVAPRLLSFLRHGTDNTIESEELVHEHA